MISSSTQTLWWRIFNHSFSLLICLVDISGGTDLRFMWRDCHRDIYLVNSKYDVYFVSWNGEQYDPHCSMNFKLNSYGLTSFEVCAKISVLSLNCNGPEVIFAKIFGHDTKRYNCYDLLPVDEFCDKSYIKIKLQPFSGIIPKENSSSKVRITIYAKELTSLNADDKIGNLEFVIVVGVIASIVFSVIVIVSGILCCGWGTVMRSCYTSVFGPKRTDGVVLGVLNNTDRGVLHVVTEDSVHLSENDHFNFRN